jgi:CRISPR-associated endonuclease Cas1
VGRNQVKTPWLAVAGFGAHIKSTPRSLIVQRDGRTEEYPIDTLRHLILIGGHTIHTAAVMHLVGRGVAISIFSPEGRPVAFIRPHGTMEQDRIREIQRDTPKHPYAIRFARAAIKARLISIQGIAESRGQEVMYRGELELIHKASDEMEYLITLDEIRRLHKLTEDMYYEIASRMIPPELSFRRRTGRPYTDAVNAMLSFGYAVLYGNCLVSATGAGLDPDDGMLHRGRGSLIYDLIEAWKPGMVDAEVFRIACDSLEPSDYDTEGRRCILSDGLMERMIVGFHQRINQERIDDQICRFCRSLTGDESFEVLY